MSLRAAKKISNSGPSESKFKVSGSTFDSNYDEDGLEVNVSTPDGMTFYTSLMSSNKNRNTIRRSRTTSDYGGQTMILGVLCLSAGMFVCYFLLK